MISGKNITRRTFLHCGACLVETWCIQKSQRGIQKILSALKLILCGLVVFIDMNTDTEVGRSFKTFLEEDYAIALDSCYLFTKKC